MDGAWRRPPKSLSITGTPSLSEVPSVGARAFCLLLGFSKVSRCKSGTISSRYPNNGYVHRTTAFAGKPAPTFLDRGATVSLWSAVRPLRRQASSHIWIAGRQLECGRLSGRFRRQASCHIWIAGRQLECGRLLGHLRRQASSHIWIAGQPLEGGRLPGRLYRLRYASLQSPSAL